MQMLKTIEFFFKESDIFFILFNKLIDSYSFFLNSRQNTNFRDSARSFF